MSISGLDKVSFYDDTDGSVFQFNKLAQEGQLVINGIEAEEASDGSRPYHGDVSELEVMVYDEPDGGIDALKQKIKDNIRLEAVGAGLQQSFLWYEPAHVRIRRPFFFAPGSRTRTTISMRKEGGVHKIKAGVNLLDMVVKMQGFATGWQDSEGDGIADGYQVDAGVHSFADGEQTIEHDQSSFLELDNEFGSRSMEFTFPITGVQITISMEYVSLHADAQNAIHIRLLDMAQNLIDITTDDAVTTGRISVTSTIVPNTYYIRPRLMRINQVNSMGTITARLPTLRMGTSDQYTPY